MIKKTKIGGFTLVEILVAVAVFSLIMGVASTVFVSAIKTQRRSLASQELLDQTSYAIEYMSRAVRMAKKDFDGSCTGLANLNYRKIDSRIIFENYDGFCQEFFLQDGRLKEDRAGTENYLTSPDLNIVSFNIGPDDSWDQDDNLQPRVTVSLDIEGKNQTKIKVQTTISQRNLDIVY